MTSTELASFGKKLFEQGMESEVHQDTPTASSSQPIKNIPFNRKCMGLVFATLFLILIIYQTFIQFIVKLIDNENVLKLIHSYIEQQQHEMKITQLNLSNLMCKMNGTDVTCSFYNTTTE